MVPFRGRADKIVARPFGSGLRSALSAVAMCALFAVAALAFVWLPAPPPVRSQAVEVLKLDVNVVARGYRVSKLLGKSVVNNTNQQIGSLDDIIIDRNRTISYAILQVGSFLGLGGHLVAVPFESLVIDETGSRIELPNATRDQLEKLTEFKYKT